MAPGIESGREPKTRPSRVVAGKGITWELDLDYALRLAKAGGKPVLLYFHDPDCVACQAQESETFVDGAVVSAVKEQVVPAWLPHDHIPLSSEYGVTWSPSLLVLDPEGRAHRREIGFLPAEELVPFLLMGCAGVYFDGDKFDYAVPLLEKLLAQHGSSAYAPEARFLLGAATWKASNDPSRLRLTYEDLQRTWPDSLWAKKARPYARL